MSRDDIKVDEVNKQYPWSHFKYENNEVQLKLYENRYSAVLKDCDGLLIGGEDDFDRPPEGKNIKIDNSKRRTFGELLQKQYEEKSRFGTSIFTVSYIYIPFQSLSEFFNKLSRFHVSDNQTSK